MHKKGLDMVALVLLVIGGLNWGIMGLTGSTNVVWMLFGSWPMLVNIIYILVGVSAVYVGAMAMKKTGM